MSKQKNQKHQENDGRVPPPVTAQENTSPLAGEGSTSPLAAAREDMCPPEEELVALKDRYARLLADFDNFRKRQAREREDWSRRANELLLEDFLPVVDHLELALGNAPDPSGPFAAGVGLVRDQFIAALEKHGVTPLDARGQPFDPDWHEALSQVPSDTVPEGGVIEQFRCGWCIGGRLMRPAQVIVSSGAPQG